MDVDLLNPSFENEFRKHKLKRIVQMPQSYFFAVKCEDCNLITTIFSHAQSVITCERYGYSRSITYPALAAQRSCLSHPAVRPSSRRELPSRSTVEALEKDIYLEMDM